MTVGGAKPGNIPSLSSKAPILARLRVEPGGSGFAILWSAYSEIAVMRLLVDEYEKPSTAILLLFRLLLVEFTLVSLIVLGLLLVPVVLSLLVLQWSSSTAWTPKTAIRLGPSSSATPWWLMGRLDVLKEGGGGRYLEKVVRCFGVKG